MPGTGILVGSLLGCAAASLAVATARNAYRLKAAEGRGARVLIAFWMTVAGYFTFLAVVKATYVVGSGTAGDPGPVVAYYIQTTSGAATIPWMVFIVSFLLFPSPRIAHGAAAFFGLVAAVVVAGVFVFGVDGPFAIGWTVEFIPSHAGVRALILAAYVIVPSILGSVLVAAGGSHSGPLRRRSRLFGGSVVLMYVPEAFTYVQVAGGERALFLHAVAVSGAFLGWLAYAPRASARGIRDEDPADA